MLNLSDMNLNVVFLILKIYGTECIVNFCFKIIEKNLVDRFVMIDSIIIFPNQNYFIKEISV